MRAFRKLFVTLLGFVIVVVGVILIPLPGPGWLIVFGGLTVLGWEYDAPKRWVASLRARFRRPEASK